jgi:hypothetical protein
MDGQRFGLYIERAGDLFEQVRAEVLRARQSKDVIPPGMVLQDTQHLLRMPPPAQTDFAGESNGLIGSHQRLPVR